MPSHPYHLAELPDGPAATAQTIAVMARLAAGAYGAQNPQVRDRAVSIVAGVASRDYAGEAAAVLTWVRGHCRYRRDPVGLERVATALVTIADQAGDCDDLALLTASLLAALGHQTRFVTGGMATGSWSHVWLEDQLNGVWVPLDPCDPEERPPGWSAAFPAICPWPINTAAGFDPDEALSNARRDGLAGVTAMDGIFDWLGTKPAFAQYSTDPALGPLPDPLAWWNYYDGNPPMSGSTVDHWDQATTAQRGAWLKAMTRLSSKDNAAKADTVAALDTAVRVTTAVATLGTSEVLRAWDALVADCHTYRDKRAKALLQAQALGNAYRPADAQAVRDAIQRGDNAIRAKLSILEPFLASEAGLSAPASGMGFIPTIIGGMAAPVALALIAAVAVAVAFALAEVAKVLDSFTAATGGAPWLLILAAAGAYWYWKKQQAKAGAPRINPAWRARR